MPGVEIISKMEITTIPDWIGIIIGILMLVFAVCLAIQMHKHGYVKKLLPVCTPLFLMAFFLIAGMTFWAEPTGQYKYTAYIDEPVNMVEFFEQYDNVTFDGEIFTFEDKERR